MYALFFTFISGYGSVKIIEFDKILTVLQSNTDCLFMYHRQGIVFKYIFTK